MQSIRWVILECFTSLLRGACITLGPASTRFDRRPARQFLFPDLDSLVERSARRLVRRLESKATKQSDSIYQIRRMLLLPGP
jgi:hypothetical protein